MSAGNLLVCAGAVLIGVAMLTPSHKSGGAGMPTVNESAAAPAVGGAKRVSNTDPVTAPAPRELRRGADGHFYADAQVNGTTIRFLIDTGASMVVLTRQDAQRAGIQLPSERQLAMGVGGPIEVIPVTLDRVAVGGIEARGVAAAIADETPVSLLGQSYLQRVGSVEIRGDTMVLR
jgi:aspartyl protease family protein